MGEVTKKKRDNNRGTRGRIIRLAQGSSRLALYWACWGGENKRALRVGCMKNILQKSQKIKLSPLGAKHLRGGGEGEGRIGGNGVIPCPFSIRKSLNS